MPIQVTLAKKNGPNDKLQWSSYLGIIARGRPESLVLIRLPVKTTTKKAPGPGPLRLGTWRPIADKYLKDSHTIMHTDAARAYMAPIAGVVHTHVIHQKKKVDGKWVKPHYTRKMRVRLPTGHEVQRIAGTQTIDGLWTTLRKESRKHQGNFDLLDQMVRVTQWMIWNRNRDLTNALSMTCQDA